MKPSAIHHATSAALSPSAIRVRLVAGPCPIGMNGFRWPWNRTERKRRVGMSLTELMCVTAILSILAALYLPAIVRACVRIKHFPAGM